MFLNHTWNLEHLEQTDPPYYTAPHRTAPYRTLLLRTVPKRHRRLRTVPYPTRASPVTYRTLHVPYRTLQGNRRLRTVPYGLTDFPWVFLNTVAGCSLTLRLRC